MKCGGAWPDPKRSLRQNLRRALHALVRQTQSPDFRQVHHARVLLKRCRAFAKLIRSGLRKDDRAELDRVEEELARAARQLGPWRDREVWRQTLLSIHPASSERPCHRPRVTEAGPISTALDEATRVIAQTARIMERRLTDVGGRKIVRSGLGNSYRQAYRRAAIALAGRDPASSHRWRIAVKRLGYQLEWLEGLAPRRFRRFQDELRRLGRLLGLEHDLSQAMAKLDRPGQRRETIEEIERRIEKVRAKSARLAEECLREAPQRFAERTERAWRRWKARRRAIGRE